MSFSAGQQVVAIKDIGGVARSFVPKGAKGVVTEAGGFFSGPARVLFTIKRVFGDEQVEVRAEDHEVA
ncbi:MAG: hypothetical protein L0H31_17080 [Nocardioidaceae bacterium]|nr:hypothetical protein [Nocardioidaceae bacterium]